jgi:hypothetical protein
MKVGDLVTWNGHDSCQGSLGMVVDIENVKPLERTDYCWHKRYVVRWFDTWDSDALGYRYEELNTVSKVCAT